MKKYIVAIEETVVDEFEVEAYSEEEALDIAREKYHSCTFVLEPGEVQYKQMAIINQNNGDSEWIEF